MTNISVRLKNAHLAAASVEFHLYWRGKYENSKQGVLAPWKAKQQLLQSNQGLGILGAASNLGAGKPPQETASHLALRSTYDGMRGC
jgi:hypothetical protein